MPFDVDDSVRRRVVGEKYVLLRPLRTRDEAYGYGPAIAYLEASGQGIDPACEPWRDLISEIRALGLESYEVAERPRLGGGPPPELSRFRWQQLPEFVVGLQVL
ncbi:hypothetical protein ABZ920_00740 [Streptomyces sp. NPDC046831]|uniref:hypothetical protein n=1 Tax=Streptomyces sp. NPDC046831 TaxID=3154805 RepID=UPI0033C97F17